MGDGANGSRGSGEAPKHGVTRRQFLKTAAGAGVALSVAGALAPAGLTSAIPAGSGERLAGFTASRAARQLALEGEFRGIVSPDVAESLSIALSDHPQLVGTAGLKASRRYSMQKLAEYGLDPRVYAYDVYISKPRSIEVTQTRPDRREVRVREKPFPGQENFEDVVAGYNAYSPAGDVTGELVYVNYGLPEDYEALEKLGVGVEGRIVIARYGDEWRGLKPKFAERRGAVGCIIYSDPEDDGYAKGKTYPEGPWRAPRGIQRGSIIDLPIRPGDPLTPAEPSVPGTRRLAPEDSETLPRIPTTPLSYAEAAPLLRALGGPEAPKGFQGALPFTYRVGPGPTEVRLNLDIVYEQTPVENVVVEIPGASRPEQKVIVGAHYDCWTYGTHDNTSGWVSVLEIARALAELGQRGWRPKRTIVLAGWDGEEYGLLGSTEWVEQFRDDLRENAVAYINMDGTGGREFGAGGVPCLDELLYAVTQTVEDGAGGSVYEGWKSGGKRPEIERLGSGSDYTAFLDFVGIPSVDVGFSTKGGEYHSSYDDLDFVRRFGEPGYAHHAAAARISGVMALRLANADVLPLEYPDYADEVVGYLRSLQDLQERTYGEQKVDLEPEVRQARRWKAATEGLRRVAEDLLNSGGAGVDAGSRIEAINEALLRQERRLTQAVGLPGRPWYKHQIYAPGLDTGYAVQELSALEDALEGGDFATAGEYKRLLGDSLRGATVEARRAAGVPPA